MGDLIRRPRTYLPEVGLRVITSQPQCEVWCHNLLLDGVSAIVPSLGPNIDEILLFGRK